MNGFSFLLIHPDVTIVMLSMRGLCSVPTLHHGFLSGYSGQNLEHQGSNGILAGIVTCGLDLSLRGVLLD